jgi:hypothetical protein
MRSARKVTVKRYHEFCERPQTQSTEQTLSEILLAVGVLLALIAGVSYLFWMRA